MELADCEGEDCHTGNDGWQLSVCSPKVLQMGREVEVLEEPSAQCRRRGHVDRELKSLQQRVRNALDGWLEYYQVAIGIKCPHMEWMSDAQRRTSRRREVQSAALPSLNLPEQADAEPVQPEEGMTTLLELHSHLPAPKKKPLHSYHKLPRSLPTYLPTFLPT
ncbi:hypothetical protein EYF80_007752 [Liparis tanakae]|uniref:Uncharacterized protein n=1 Tax=Liparis tanakae TaxID=230148 RepID=A0A4Z2IW42_9TELE|nr:hypothetical protein EYF80_007752 [Liparis tanakae]